MTMAVMSNNPARGDDVDANANALKCTTSFGQATQVLTITHGGNALTFPIDTHKDGDSDQLSKTPQTLPPRWYPYM
jgi:hypothetical protein